MARYGVPYRGSKSRIAEWVVGHIPSGPVLMDLFGGGAPSLTAPSSRAAGVATS